MFVGGQGKNAVCESWGGLETGWGDVEELGEGLPEHLQRGLPPEPWWSPELAEEVNDRSRL